MQAAPVTLENLAFNGFGNSGPFVGAEREAGITYLRAGSSGATEEMPIVGCLTDGRCKSGQAATSTLAIEVP